jgi:ATP-dependent Clp protease ATP-binding subunit ClpC
MFERYTEKARRVIFFARYEASQFGAAQIEAEHILLGLMREDKNLVTHFFNRSQFSIEAVRNKIEERATVRERIPTTVDLPLSEESKQVLKFAAEESERLDHRHIGTGHLLLGLLLVKESLAFALLEECGVKADEVREWLKELSEEKESVRRRDHPTVRECFSDADSRHHLAALIIR